MREIKFAWVCRNVKFNTITREELTDEMLLSHKYPAWINPGNNNCELIAKILPTGRKDSNGKEIYEGDVVAGHGGGIYKIVWSEYWAGFFREVVKPSDYEPNGSILQPLFSGITSHGKPIESIIGNIYFNIYENPDLLEVTHGDNDLRPF